MAPLRQFAETCEAIAATTKKTEKVQLLAAYLKNLSIDDAARAAVFFTGRPFARIEEKTLLVGGSLLWQTVANMAGGAPAQAEAIYRKHGDLGAMAEEMLAGKRAADGLGLGDLEACFATLQTRRGPTEKLPVVEGLLRRADALEAKYIIKIITGDLRIGLRESLVEEAIACAFDRPLASVQRANMLLGDTAATLRLAAEDKLAEARLRLFQPIAFMLASPSETAAEAMEYFPAGAQVEDKFDGIRAQAHKGVRDGKPAVRIFSRTLDAVAEFPELTAPLAALPGEFVLDGEILAWENGRALPFTELQQRLGRKQVDLLFPHPIPINFLVFDLLYADGEVLLDLPLRERRTRLELLLRQSHGLLVQLSPARTCTTAPELQGSFAQALARGNEGVMAKAPDSPYTPGRRGQNWRKLKAPLATLDVVVVAVEHGHGKRHAVLSDYTFAVRTPNGLATIGKAFTGLTDAEIAQLTEFFKAHTLEDFGWSRRVEPLIVIEVAFNNIQRSDRHESGYALRFPRIVRLRPDKPVTEIDTLDLVKELYERQFTVAGGSASLAQA